MRVVVDTNVLVSGILRPEGPPGLVLEAHRRGEFKAVAGFALATEIAEVLRRPRLRRMGITEQETLDALVLLAPILPDVEMDLPLRDPKDAPVLAAALAGGADIIVTGDRDFLDDGDLRALLLEKGIAVETPADFLGRLR